MSHSDSSHASEKSLASNFASDPAMAELIAFFAGDLDHRIQDIRRSLEENNLDALNRLAHQLKGSAGGYGYPSIGHAAAKLEAATMQAESGQAKSLQASADELIALCERARAA